MEGAQPLESGSRALERDEVAHHLLDACGVLYLLYRGTVYHTCMPYIIFSSFITKVLSMCATLSTAPSLLMMNCW